MYKTKHLYLYIVILFITILKPLCVTAIEPSLRSFSFSLARYPAQQVLGHSYHTLRMSNVVPFARFYHTVSTDHTIVPFTDDHVSLLQEAFCGSPWNKPSDLFVDYLREQKSKERLVWLALTESKACGYVTLKWKSLYAPFLIKGIPEVSDLNVVPKFRCRGIGAALVEIAEKAAKENNCSLIGLGVGLYKDYGYAQKLYIKRGYIPDGEGVTYGFHAIKPGEKVILDDNLNLWLQKKL